MRWYQKFILIAALVLSVSAVYATPGEAQWRVHPRTRVVVGAYFGYPYYYGPYYYSPFYNPFWAGSYYWGPYYYQRYPRRWADRERRDTVEVRTDISPKEAQIYVDGYFSGMASDYDRFKRLRVPPGQHEIVLYLKGYKTVRQALDVQPGKDYEVRATLQPLGPGERNEAPPTPPPQPDRAEPQRPPEAAPPDVPAPSDAPRRRMPRAPREAPVEAQGFGSLAIRVQPAGAEVLIDGQRWQGPEGPGPLIVQVAEGPHRVEVRKEGYQTFSTEVQVRQGERAPLNISLSVER